MMMTIDHANLCQGGPLLTDTDIARGLSAPIVAQQLLGTTGEFLMLLLVLMAVMSTGEDNMRMIT